MSKISTLLDEIRTQLALTLPTHNQLFDPVIIENNDQLCLDKGYGAAVSGGSNSERQLSCTLSVNRDFIITLSRAIRGTNRSTTIIQTAEKALLEDQLLVINLIEKNDTINTIAANSKFISDNGIEPIFEEKGRAWIMVQSIFSMEYFETLT